MQHSESKDELIDKSVSFTIFLRNYRAYKLASLTSNAQVRECIRRTKEEAEEDTHELVKDCLQEAVLMQYCDLRAMSVATSMLSEQLTQSSEEDCSY